MLQKNRLLHMTVTKRPDSDVAQNGSICVMAF